MTTERAHSPAQSSSTRSITHRLTKRLHAYWARFWLGLAGPGPAGRFASRLAALFTPPFYGRMRLAALSPQGYIDAQADISHTNLRRGKHTLIAKGVTIYQGDGGGPVVLEDGVFLNNNTIVQTGRGGSVTIGERTNIQAGCHISAFHRSITIGRRVDIAPNCGLFPYNHGLAPDAAIRAQPLISRGDIVIGDDAWLGFGVVVLDGVRIGNGAVIGANAVVTTDIPDGAIAAGNPARVVKMRDAAHE
jgi:acetyltransferase-like isoleucine patch superfamily enzyme